MTRILLCCLLIICTLPAAFAHEGVEFSEPNLASNNYTTAGNTFAESSGNQCTWYVYGRVRELQGIELAFTDDSSRDAYRWDEILDAGYERGQVPRAGAIAIWEHRTRPDFGHVAYVEHVYGGVVFYTEANFSSFGDGGGYDGRLKYDPIDAFENDKGRNQSYRFITYIYPSQSNQSLIGTWRGSVSQPGSRPYSLVLTLRWSDDQRLTGESDYPELQCGGRLGLAESRQGNLRFEERISSNRGRCLDGYVELAPADNGTLEWTWYTRSNREAASAILRRFE